MSAASHDIPGVAAAYASTPANTNEATLFTAGKRGGVLVQMYIANVTGSAANATVKWGDGSTDHAVVSVKSIAGNDYLHLDMNIPLREGQTVKITSGTNSALTFTAVVIERIGAGRAD